MRNKKKKVRIQSSSSSKIEGFLVPVVDRNSLILHIITTIQFSFLKSCEDKTIDFIKPAAQQKGSNQLH